MRKYGYQRSSATLMVRKRSTRRKKPFSLFKFLSFFLILTIGVGGIWMGGRYVYYAIKNARITDWHVKSVAISGISGSREKEIFNRITVLKGKPFSMADADRLQKELITKYPMLTKISVSRGLFDGKLKVSARQRQPVAQFILSDDVHKYVDADSVVYDDSQETREVLRVKLIGEAPSRLDASFVDLVQELLKLKKTLPFESLEFNVLANTVTLSLPDQSEIHFASPVHLKEKVRRAAQIMMLARGKHALPATLDFTFFEEGKVFLTQTAH